MATHRATIKPHSVSVNVSYIPAVDHLRGFAETLMVFYHGLTLISYAFAYGAPFNYDRWLSAGANPLYALVIEGHSAVALFMTLSGFIFAHAALGKQVAYRPFITNRLLRIFPMFMLMIFLAISTYPDKFTLSGFFQTVLLFISPYMPGALYLGPFGALFWTIAVEFQFYLIFPFLMRFFNERGPRYALGLIGLMLLLRVVSYGANPDNIRELSYWTIIGRLDQFLIGMCVAWLYRRMRDIPAWARIAGRALPAVFALLCALIWGYNRAGGWPAIALWKVAWPTIEGAIWGALILSYLFVAPRLPARLSRLMAVPGEMSYSMYLMHYAVISGLLQSGWLPQWGWGPESSAMLATLLIVLPITLLISAVTYRLVEKPFMGMRVRYLRELETASS